MVHEGIKRKGLKEAEKHDLNKTVTQYQEGDKLLVKAYNLSDKFLKQNATFMAVFEETSLIAKVTWISCSSPLEYIECTNLGFQATKKPEVIKNLNFS